MSKYFPGFIIFSMLSMITFMAYSFATQSFKLVCENSQGEEVVHTAVKNYSLDGLTLSYKEITDRGTIRRIRVLVEGDKCDVY